MTVAMIPAGACAAGGSDAAPPLLLALHSSSQSLGVGVQRLGGGEAPRLGAFPLGRALSNQLLECIESVLPAVEWPRLGRLAVAIGPGGFTGTRLTVVLARTLAQQLGVPLDGVSSFHLIARRLCGGGELSGKGSFWLVQELPRHGLVAGLYDPDPQALGGVVERLAPRLFRSDDQLDAAAGGVAPGEVPRCPVGVRLPEDVEELLAFSQSAAAAGLEAPWQQVLPLYPTSPVEPRSW
jgi:tRNA threonylcarbamoyladenosine biosynthesis protein TsaB